MMNKLKVIKKTLKYVCYCCKQSIRGVTVPKKDCKACKGTGYFTDEIYYHIINGICIDGDTIK